MIGMVVIVLAGLTYSFLVDPVHSNMPSIPCFVHKTTGIYCPGCGDTRALHALVHGHVIRAFDYNLLFPFIVLTLAWYYLVALTTLFFRRRVMWIPEQVTTKGAIAILVVIVLFTVLRNIPAWPFSILAP